MKKVKLLDVCDVYQPKTIAAKSLKGGQYSVYGANGVIGYHSEYNHEESEVVMGCRGSCGLLHLTQPYSWINGNAMVVKPNGKTQIDKKFLLYALMSKNKNSIITGTANPQITRQNLKDFEIPICDIEEQERIVNHIESTLSKLNESVETLQKTKQQLSVYRQAVLKETFDSVSNQCITSIEKLCQRIVDCPHSTPKWSKEGVLCLRPTNFKRGYLDLSEKNYVTKEVFEKRNARLIPLPGDVLYSREGAILGIACIIPENTYVCLGQRMMLFRTGENLYNRFLMYYLNSPNVTSFVKSITGGSASPHINVGDIKQFKISCPDIDTQKELSKELDKKFSICNGIEGTVDSALQQTEVLRQSILKQVFEGEA